MSLFRKKTKPAGLTRLEALECTPVKNPQVTETRLQSGELLLLYPVSPRPWLAALAGVIGGKTDRVIRRKLQLDVLGTQVWSLMDGSRTVKSVVRRFSRENRVPPKEAELAVSRFLRELGRRGLIGLR